MMHYVTITSQGQITIPAEFRRKLNFRKNSQAIIKEEDKKLVIEPVPDILELEGVFHSALKGQKRIPFRKIRKAFEEAMGRGEV